MWVYFWILNSIPLVYIYPYSSTTLFWLHINNFWLGFPRGSDGKEYTCNAGDLDSIPGLGRSPGEGNSYPLQYSGLGNSMDRGAWQATVHGVAKSWTQLSDSHSLHFWLHKTVTKRFTDKDVNHSYLRTPQVWRTALHLRSAASFPVRSAYLPNPTVLESGFSFYYF